MDFVDKYNFYYIIPNDYARDIVFKQNLFDYLDNNNIHRIDKPNLLEYFKINTGFNSLNYIIKKFGFDINNKNLKTNETESNYILIIINFISISFHNVISTKN